MQFALYCYSVNLDDLFKITSNLVYTSLFLPINHLSIDHAGKPSKLIEAAARGVL